MIEPTNPDGEQRVEGTEPEDSPAATPFDNPYFLPAVLWALAAWFGWDIVSNAQAYQDYPNFNRGGFIVLSVVAIWYTRSAIKERQAERESKPD